MTAPNPDKRRGARQRERRARKQADHILRDAINAIGGDADDFEELADRLQEGRDE